MNITEYTTEVIKRCEPLSESAIPFIKGIESMQYNVDEFYDFEMINPFSSLSYIAAHKKNSLTKKEQMQISGASGMFYIIDFMIVFFQKSKELNQDFSIYQFLLEHGIIKHYAVKEMSEFSID